jgi:multidrug efflux pump
LFSRFFIDRPIFASVLSIVITLAGAIALVNLPIALYPPISPPVVQVDCTYPGASAEVVSQAVAAPIEQQVNGVENMLYMSSQCTNDGSYNLTVTFKHGVDLNMAQVLVQNRVVLAVPMLPDVIKATGVTVRKKAPDILMAIAINSPDNSHDQLYLSNFAWMRIKEELARLPGVSDVSMLGQRDYSMRVWVDPDKLAERSMTAGDVVRAIREQNAQVATGQIGQPPIPSGQPAQLTLSTLGRLVEVEQFEKIVVKSSPDGRLTHLKDVARVELGAKNENISCKVNGKPSASLAVFQLPDANALDTADIIKAKMEELKAEFPPGVGYEIRYDTTPFIRESIGEVFKTLRDAVILVALVVLLFLQNWRSAVIPLIAVPVAIIGTFAVMAAMGFTLNNLTLFGLVLAIGIVVDDAIVVVESVEHHMERGLSPYAATVKAMDEVAGPVIAIGLVLSAVFVPCAFITGITGQFFRQFALTIATSTIISTFNSLTLSPALAAMLLRPKDHEKHDPLPRPGIALLGAVAGYASLSMTLVPRLASRIVGASGPVTLHDLMAMKLGPLLAGTGLPLPAVLTVAAVALGAAAGWVVAPAINLVLSWIFRAFNASFSFSTGIYSRVVGSMLRVSALVLLVYGGLIYLTYWGFTHTPSGFIPTQDMGYLLVNVQLTDAASLERTQEVMDQLEKLAKETPGVKFTQTMTGQSLLLSAFGSNFGSMFIILDEFSERRTRDLSGEAIIAALQKKFDALVYEAQVTVLGPPPVRGVGRAGGFKMMVEDRGDVGPRVLQEQTENLTDVAKGYVEKETGKPAVTRLSSVFRANVPQLFFDANRRECMTKEVALRDLFDTLQIYLGSLYVNDFNLFGRTWQVIVQAEPRFRNTVDSIKRLKVRNVEGAMVPLGGLADVELRPGPLVLTRYNMYPAAPLNGNAAPGVSSGHAMDTMDELADDNLMPTMSHEWTELAFLERQAGNTAMIVFAFSVVMVFLVLAAQYESWAMPLAIILVVPMCLLSGVAGVRVAGDDINIFTQIGFVVLVGLASKNAILIVVFAKQQAEQGLSRYQATLTAVTLRLRPIIMTSLAFILGVVPLLVSHGAGAEMRRTLGTTVFSGMLGVTAFGIFLTPVFYFVIGWLSETRTFASPAVRFVGKIALYALTLGILPALYWIPLIVREIRRPTPPLKPAAPDDLAEVIGGGGNGDRTGANGNGHGDGGHVEKPGELVENK